MRVMWEALKFQLGCCPVYFELMLQSMKNTQRQIEKLFHETFCLKTHKLILIKSNSCDTNLARQSDHVSKIGWADGKNHSTQISHQGAQADLKMYKTFRMKYLQIHKFPFEDVFFLRGQTVPENSSKTLLLGCVSKQAEPSDRPWKIILSREAFLCPQKENRAFFWTFPSHLCVLKRF